MTDSEKEYFNAGFGLGIITGVLIVALAVLLFKSFWA